MGINNLITKNGAQLVFNTKGPLYDIIGKISSKFIGIESDACAVGRLENDTAGPYLALDYRVGESSFKSVYVRGWISNNRASITFHSDRFPKTITVEFNKDLDGNYEDAIVNEIEKASQT